MSPERELTDEEIGAMLKPGSLAHQLWVAARASAPIERRAKRAPGDPPTRRRIDWVRPSDQPTRSKLQPGSARRAVMEWILGQLVQPVPMAALEETFGPAARGHAQKLIVTGHLISVRAEEATK